LLFLQQQRVDNFVEKIIIKKQIIESCFFFVFVFVISAAPAC